MTTQGSSSLSFASTSSFRISTTRSPHPRMMLCSDSSTRLWPFLKLAMAPSRAVVSTAIRAEKMTTPERPAMTAVILNSVGVLLSWFMLPGSVNSRNVFHRCALKPLTGSGQIACKMTRSKTMPKMAPRKPATSDMKSALLPRAR